jgi:ATP-dependent RNA helicase DeaD
MNLKSELVEALKRINFIQPTDVQEQVIPVALSGSDVIVRAKTGTGKTCAFLIPIIQKGATGRNPQAIIIVPTRELALQIDNVAKKILPRGMDGLVVYGGVSIDAQIRGLKRGPALVIGTPGRIIDLINRNALDLESIKFLVLDEADTMLDMGFIDDIEFIMSTTPQAKQTLLFSATMPEKILRVAKKYMQDPAFMKIGKDDELVVNKIKHYYAVCDNRMKAATLLAYIKQYSPKKAIVFVGTKYASNAIYDTLKDNGVDAVLMHGGLTQSKREHSLRIFRGGARFLIATSIAARGLDVTGVTDIINFDIPEDPYVYVHKVGRAARMGTDGKAFTIVGRDQTNLIRDIEYTANIKMEKIDLDASEFAHIRAFKGQDRGGRQFGGNSRFGRGRRDFRSSRGNQQHGHYRRFNR